jgi:hypothetical protein
MTGKWLAHGTEWAKSYRPNDPYIVKACVPR